MSLVLVEGLTQEPVTVDTAKAHLRVDANDDDGYISSLIPAARKHIEEIIGRRLGVQTWRLEMDSFPDPVIELPLPPLVSLEKVEHVTAGGTEEIDLGEFLVDPAKEPGIIIKKSGVWPTEELIESGGFKVTFKCGYEDCPESLKQALLYLVSHFYEFREPVISGTIVAKIPDTLGALLAPHRVWGF